MTAPTPLSDADDLLTRIQQVTYCERRWLSRNGGDADSLRYYIDRIRNALQALEGCAAAIEPGKQVGT